MEEFLLCPEIEGYFFLFEPRDWTGHVNLKTVR